jgi:hypothetical protein
MESQAIRRRARLAEGKGAELSNRTPHDANGANELLAEASFAAVRNGDACVALQQALVRPRITPELSRAAKRLRLE